MTIRFDEKVSDQLALVLKVSSILAGCPRAHSSLKHSKFLGSFELPFGYVSLK